MKRTRKALVLSCLFALLAVQISSCGDSAHAPDKTSAPASADSASAPVTETETAPAVPVLPPDLPEMDFGGTSFDILTAGDWSNSWTEIYDFKAEEETGDPINDAVFRRNLAAEEHFHVKINEINRMGDSGEGRSGQGLKLIKQSVMASDNAYDASQMGGYDVSTLAHTGYILDLNADVPHLDLSGPWWDQKANEDLAIRGKMFYSTGDISTLDNDCTFCILFNKKMIETFDLENPYELVRSGKWTIDKFIEMASVGSKDLNGDSKFDENDRYGFCIWQDSMMGMVNAAGEKFCTVSPEGELLLTLNTERTQTMLSKYMTLAYDRTKTFSLFHSGNMIEAMFANDQVLFFTKYLCITKKFRDMETDFGILPYPKFDETQEAYYSTVSQGCSFICVPAAVENVEMTGAVLEALACASVSTVTPAYYDITLEGKVIRDDESAEMLDIILGNRVFDLGLFYQVGRYDDGVMDLFRKSNTEFVSMFEKRAKRAEKDLAKINEAFASVE